jgi:hypothetical protein
LCGRKRIALHRTHPRSPSRATLVCRVLRTCLEHAPQPLALTRLDMRSGHPEQTYCTREAPQVEVLTPRRLRSGARMSLAGQVAIASLGDDLRTNASFTKLFADRRPAEQQRCGCMRVSSRPRATVKIRVGPGSPSIGEFRQSRTIRSADQAARRAWSGPNRRALWISIRASGATGGISQKPCPA